MTIFTSVKKEPVEEEDFPVAVVVVISALFIIHAVVQIQWR